MSSVRLGVLVAAFLLVVSGAHAQFQPFRPLPAMPPVPTDNPWSPAKVSLGEQLFFDPRLSVNGRVSCNSCHNLMAGGEDGQPVSVGATGKATRRNAPTLWNVGFNSIYFRDGRHTSLERALEDHLVGEETTGLTARGLTGRLESIPGYVQSYADAFGDEPLSVAGVARALAAYLRTLNTPNSAFDRYLRGEANALSPQAQQGFQLFVDSGCASCHFWVNLAGPVPGLAFQMGEGFYELFPNHVGSEYDQRYALLADSGRYGVTGDPADQRLWRVSGLRNVALTAPYFHNGSVATLDEAVRVMAKTQLKLTFSDAQVADIIAFLNTLTGDVPPQIMPRLPAAAGTAPLGEDAHP